MNIKVYITKNNNKWNIFPLNLTEIKDLTKKLLSDVFEFLKINTKNKFEIFITLTSDEEIRQINKEYRNKDSSTNVLSFPLFEKEALKNIDTLPLISLGDVIIAYETLEKESIEQKITIKYHFTHLLLHSILHLLGYDHIEDKDAEVMERIEEQILKKYPLI